MALVCPVFYQKPVNKNYLNMILDIQVDISKQLSTYGHEQSVNPVAIFYTTRHLIHHGRKNLNGVSR